MPLIYQHRYYRADLRNNPNVFYLFGDNEQREGYGGQAGEARDEKNAIGIRTCNLATPWSEADSARQIKMIDEDLARVFELVLKGENVVVPNDGMGTGIATLAELSPTTFLHLETKMEELHAASRRPFPLRPTIGILTYYSAACDQERLYCYTSDMEEHIRCLNMMFQKPDQFREPKLHTFEHANTFRFTGKIPTRK